MPHVGISVATFNFLSLSQIASKSELRFSEFVPLMASMMALVALSIDTMLPALPVMSQDLGVASENQIQLVVSMIFLGMAIGLTIYGTIADSIGRKPAVYIGFSLFVVGSLVSYFAKDLTIMLVGRVLQGLGLAAPRVIVLTLVRDQYSGNNMARVMSFVMMVFILVPTVAPSLGQAILYVAPWPILFLVLLGIGVVVLTWFALRQPETLKPEDKRPLSFKRTVHAMGQVLSNRISLGYTLAWGMLSSAFLGFISSVQPILESQYGLGEKFPLYFGMLALFIGSASFVNGRLVDRYGMRKMATTAICVLIITAVVMLTVRLAYGGQLPLVGAMAYLVVTLFCVGILFGNLNSLAMEPLGHIAGIGSSVVNAMATFISLPFGIFISQAYNGTMIPLVAGFAVFGLFTLLFMRWVVAKPKGSEQSVPQAG